MSIDSRRKFLKQIGAAAGVFIASRSVFPSSKFPLNFERDFEMLVIGDSLVAGQGLREKDKFYTLTKNWLEDEFLKSDRRVNLKNKSHSGARIFLSEDEIRALQDAEIAEDEFYHPEVTLSFPSARWQIEVARNEYLSEGIDPRNLDLILMSGGITNLGTSYIIDPFEKTGPLRKLIVQYCNEAMFKFLVHASDVFPNAVIAVIGYYPMVSKKSSSGAIYNSILELYKFPGPSKPLLNNILTKQFFKILHGKMNKRSRIWATESNRELQNAVNRLNEKVGRRQAVFVKSPIDDETTFETKKTLLWRMGKKGRSEDDLYDLRKIECAKEFGSLKNVDIELKQRFCELSGIGHPNVEGSKAYSEAIKKQLAVSLKNRKTVS